MNPDLMTSDTEDSAEDTDGGTSAGSAGSAGSEAPTTGTPTDDGADESTGGASDTDDPPPDTDDPPDDSDGDGVPDADDCEPDDASIFPGAQEACNGVDDDCDGDIDETWSELSTSCDGDDADECEDGVYVCNAGGDDVICSDGPETPGGEELCNGADDDCNGVADDPWVTDLGTPCDGADADQCAGGVYVCAEDGLGMECAGDMNVIEVCNGNDDDCDGQVDEGCDDDGDGHCDAGMTVIGDPAVCDPALGGDCDDTDPAVNPSADEVCNGIDDDCDLLVDAADGDTPWPALDGYEANEIFFVAPEIFEAADPTTPFGPSNTSFHSVANADFFRWDDTVGPVPPTFMMCHLSGMTGAMLVDVELGYRRSGDPALPYRYDTELCQDLGDGDTCFLNLAPSFSGAGVYEFTVGVLPMSGIDQCNAEYVLECRLDYVSMW